MKKVVTKKRKTKTIEKKRPAVEKMRDILDELAGTIPDDVAAAQLQFAWNETDTAHGFVGRRLLKGPNDPNYFSKHDNPLKAPSLNPNEKYWIAPPTGKYRQEKPENAKKCASGRKRWTKPRVVPGPKAWRIIACQPDIPEKMRGQFSTRPIVLEGPTFEIYEVPKPTPEAVELIRQGRVRGVFIDSAGVIGTYCEVGTDEELTAPDVYPGHTQKHSMHHFEQGD